MPPMSSVGSGHVAEGPTNLGRRYPLTTRAPRPIARCRNSPVNCPVEGTILRTLHPGSNRLHMWTRSESSRMSAGGRPFTTPCCPAGRLGSSSVSPPLHSRGRRTATHQETSLGWPPRSVSQAYSTDTEAPKDEEIPGHLESRMSSGTVRADSPHQVQVTCPPVVIIPCPSKPM